MRRVIFTVTNDLNYDQRMHKICGSLQKAGYGVTLVGRQRKTSTAILPKSFNQLRLKCWFDKGKLFYIEYNIRLLWFLLFAKTDIICAIDLDTIVPCALAGKWRRKKLVYDAHEYFTEVPEVMHRPMVQKVWQWVEKTYVPKMDACYTVGGSLADLFQKKHGVAFSVIMNVPLLTDNVINEDTGSDKFILYQGALNQGRGLELLIESMQKLPLKLFLAGEGDLSDSLRKLVSRLKLDDKVVFLGWVTPADLEKLTPKAFLGYNLLENLGKSYYFSLSNKFFDYIHACVPGMSNPFPEYEAINNTWKTGILTNLSTSEIVFNVERAINDKNYYQQLRENCKKAKQFFNWQQEEKKLISIYDALR
jgi:glycosyltransferase involved in cell wall biosynthesis